MNCTCFMYFPRSVNGDRILEPDVEASHHRGCDTTVPKMDLLTKQSVRGSFLMCTSLAERAMGTASLSDDRDRPKRYLKAGRRTTAKDWLLTFAP